ncbi:IS5 transposase and trans-activator [Escherichia coli]|nr:IS5 transposase and trans-activator [Escherichia coli]
MAKHGEVIEPFYPRLVMPATLSAGTMLRIHCMQHWYNLSDGAIEDALYEIASMRLFARYMKAASGQVDTISHHQATVRLREARYKGC